MRVFTQITMLALLLSVPIQAQEQIKIPDIQIQGSNWLYFGEFKTYAANIRMSNENPNIVDDDELINYNSLQIGFDYSNENFYFSATPYVYKYFTESAHEFKNPNFAKPFQDSDFFFRSLYF